MIEDNINDQEQSLETPENPECSGCPQSDACREVWSMPNQGPLTSGGLLLSSILVFLLPIVCAIISGGLYQSSKAESDSSPWLVLLVAFGGLVVGAFIAWLTMPLIKKYFYEETAGKRQKTEKQILS
ncbi:MAG: SoxR reducing system RseC family protein [Planctomycetes bacterium]|nr:SoxR reducing system RseC family protein [Planctomycetota bacterium]